MVVAGVVVAAPSHWLDKYFVLDISPNLDRVRSKAKKHFVLLVGFLIVVHLEYFLDTNSRRSFAATSKRTFHSYMESRKVMMKRRNQLIDFIDGHFISGIPYVHNIGRELIVVQSLNNRLLPRLFGTQVLKGEHACRSI